MPVIAELSRLLAATAVVGGYASLCSVILLRERRRRRRAAHATQRQPSGPGSARTLIAYASQTGFAEQLATATAQTLSGAGMAVELRALGQIDAAALSGCERALFIVSTCGEGDAPDNGALFARRIMDGEAALDGLHYGLLALGDSSYAHFCGFGRRLDAWLADNGAKAMFKRLDVDQSNAAVLQQWQHELGHLAGSADLPSWQETPFGQWRIRERRCLNPGSSGWPTFHIELEPADGSALPQWEAGDLVQVRAPADPDRPREYSIASVPADGAIHLLVRQQRRDDGTPGIASGWLTAGAGDDDTITLRLQPHRNFQLGDNRTRPLILIGNGTGLAGLRAHLRARANDDDGRNWLIFGERSAAHDFYYRDEIEGYGARDLLMRTDLAFSRDQAGRIYVQHRLLAAAETLREWVAGGAAIYVCGNAVGMAGEVDATLVSILGEARRDALLAEGRYRRDVY